VRKDGRDNLPEEGMGMNTRRDLAIGLLIVAVVSLLVWAISSFWLPLAEGHWSVSFA
jgi:hypothetical protein